MSRPSFLFKLLSPLFTVGAIKSWYPTLKKPSFNPPNSVFGPVWLILFTLMGVSLFLVWRKKEEGKPGVNPALKIFGVQLTGIGITILIAAIATSFGHLHTTQTL
ncbi:MAG: TspO/MBR family protein [Candidatus Aquicultor sp.]